MCSAAAVRVLRQDGSLVCVDRERERGRHAVQGHSHTAVSISDVHSFLLQSIRANHLQEEEARKKKQREEDAARKKQLVPLVNQIKVFIGKAKIPAQTQTMTDLVVECIQATPALVHELFDVDEECNLLQHAWKQGISGLVASVLVLPEFDATSLSHKSKKDGQTLLHMLCSKPRPRPSADKAEEKRMDDAGSEEGVLSGLIDALNRSGADIATPVLTSTTSRGKTALHLAAGAGHLPALDWLAQWNDGALMDTPDENGDSALVVAVCNGPNDPSTRLAAVEKLLELGANPVVVGAGGAGGINAKKPLLQLARIRGNADVLEALEEALTTRMDRRAGQGELKKWRGQSPFVRSDKYLAVRPQDQAPSMRAALERVRCGTFVLGSDTIFSRLFASNAPAEERLTA